MTLIEGVLANIILQNPVCLPSLLGINFPIYPAFIISALCYQFHKSFKPYKTLNNLYYKILPPPLDRPFPHWTDHAHVKVLLKGTTNPK